MGRTETEMKSQKSSDLYWEHETVNEDHKAGIRGQIVQESMVYYM